LLGRSTVMAQCERWAPALVLFTARK